MFIRFLKWFLGALFLYALVSTVIALLVSLIWHP